MYKDLNVRRVTTWLRLRVKTEVQNSLLSNINDKGDNNEKTKCLKTWVGIFRVGIFRGEFTREDFDRWEFSDNPYLTDKNAIY